MSANSWIKTAVTIRMDVREPTKKWKNLSEKCVCHWEKTHNKELGEKVCWLAPHVKHRDTTTQ